MISQTNNRLTMEIRRQSGLSRAVAQTAAMVSTGKKIQQPSDDPVAAARVASIRKTQVNEKAWMSNLNVGLSMSDQADGVLRQMSDRMAHARELTVAAASGSLSPADRATIGAELRGIATEMTEYADTRTSTGNKLFSDDAALKFRFSDSLVMAPVPSQSDVFDVGGTNLSQMLVDAAVAVESGASAAIGASLTALDTGISKTSDVAADIGVRGARMTALREQKIDQGIELSAERSGLEDTDLTEALARLNLQTVTLDAARAAFARINRENLFDLLR
jgi:flagellar hook-associated protein 3 FlgL